MVRQLRLLELVSNDPANPSATVPRRVFAFGTHPLATSEDQHAVTTAAARGNSLRVIMDELLVGNNLEEIQCRNIVDDDGFARVPLIATPDDIANCSTTDDVLEQTCKGAGAVCLCENPNGCMRGDTPVAMGQPVGVLDNNQDGAVDDTRFIQGSAGIKCGNIEVPLDLDLSYWNPSGDQNRPAQGGFDALGPAVVLTPDQALPTNIECSLAFSQEVVDKQGNQVCAPPDGDVTRGCNPGDLSAVKFKVEPLTIVPVAPANGETGVSTTGPILFEVNAPLDIDSLSNITASPAFPAFTVTTPMPNIVQLNLQAELMPATTYTVTIPTTVTDAYGQPALATITFTFTTA